MSYGPSPRDQYKYSAFCSEAEFLDVIGTKVLRVFLLAIPSQLYYEFTPLSNLSKSGFNLVCNVKTVNGILKSEN